MNDCNPIHVTLYRGARDPKPAQQDDYTSWEEVVEGLRELISRTPDCDATRTPEEQKIRLLAIAPHRLSAPHRSAGNVEAVTMLVIDVDRCDLSAVADRLDALDIAAIVYGSPSDDPAGDPMARRVRILAPVTRDIKPDECERTRFAFAESLGLAPGCGVEGAKEAAKLFFIGRLHGSPERMFAEANGSPVDVDTLLGKPLRHDWRATNARSHAAPRSEAASPNDPMVALVQDEYAAGERHELVRALAGYLARRGWDDARIEGVVRALPSDQVPLRVRTALDTAATARRGDAAPGWETLCQRLGTRGAEALRALAKDPLEPEGFDGVWSNWWARAYSPGGWVMRLEERQRARASDTKRATEAPEVEVEGPAEQRTELGNARRLVRMHGDRLRCFLAYRTWFVWDGARWAADATGEIERLAKEAAESLWADALDEDEDRRKTAIAWAAKSQDRARISNMIALAATEPGVPVTADMLDSDPWLLNVQNGTLDLRTGQLREPDPALLMTKCCAASYHPAAQSDLWNAFVARTTGRDRELASYIQRALGYALVGAWHEKHFWFGYGPPDGAKSTLLGVVGSVLGDYHVSAAASTWMVQGNLGGNRGDLTRLLGARLVTSLEIRPGLRFDEELVKKVTGGDRIVAAAKYKDEVEFPPTFALWMGANDRPTIRDDDEGMWSRMRCVPFINQVPRAEQDPRLRERLISDEHAPAVLRWLVDGCMAWQRDGLGDCEAVTAASANYRASMNQAAGFVEELLEITGDLGDEVACKAMTRAYEHWCEANGVRHPLSGKALGQRLRALGVLGGDDSTKRVVDSTCKPVGNFTPERDRHWQGVKIVR